MTVTKSALKKRSKPTKEMLQIKRIEEQKLMIDINQSFKGISWEETEIPTLTSLVNKNAECQGQEVPILEPPANFIAQKKTPNGHMANCSCIKCQPKNEGKPPPTLASVPVEKYVPFNKKQYDN
jgi:hypothetical protein